MPCDHIDPYPQPCQHADDPHRLRPWTLLRAGVVHQLCNDCHAQKLREWERVHAEQAALWAQLHPATGERA